MVIFFALETRLPSQNKPILWGLCDDLTSNFPKFGGWVFLSKLVGCASHCKFLLGFNLLQLLLVMIVTNKLLFRCVIID